LNGSAAGRGSGHRRYWEPDPAFDLKRHIIPARVKRLDGPEPSRPTWKGSQQGPGPGPPLWQIQVIPGLGDDATVILVRIHHSLGDGEALVGLLFSLVDEPQAGSTSGCRQPRAAMAARPAAHGRRGHERARHPAAPPHLASGPQPHAWPPLSGNKRVG